MRGMRGGRLGAWQAGSGGDAGPQRSVESQDTVDSGQRSFLPLPLRPSPLPHPHPPPSLKFLGPLSFPAIIMIVASSRNIISFQFLLLFLSHSLLQSTPSPSQPPFASCAVISWLCHGLDDGTPKLCWSHPTGGVSPA